VGMLRRSRLDLSVFLTIASLTSWIGFLFTYMGQYGYFGRSFPWLFILSLFLVLFAGFLLWGPREKQESGISRGLGAIQLIIGTAMLWLTPILMGGPGAAPGSVGTALQHYGYVDFALTSNHSASFSDYTMWPSAILGFSMLIRVTGLPTLHPIYLVALFPFTSELGYLLGLFMFSRRIETSYGTKFLIASGWTFLIANWFIPIFDSASFAYILLWFSIALFIASHSLQSKVVIGLLWAAMITMHFLTSIAFLLIGLVISIIMKRGIKLLNIGGLMIIGFNAFVVSAWYLSGVGKYLLSLFFKPVSLEPSSFYLPTSALFKNLAVIQTLSIVIIIFASIIGFIATLKYDRGAGKIVLAIMIGFALLFITFGKSYGLELEPRVLYMAMPAFAYLAAKLMTLRNKFVILFLAILFVLIPLHFYSTYGASITTYMPESYLSGYEYLFSHTQNGVIFSTLKGQYPPVYGHISSYPFYTPFYSDFNNPEISFNYLLKYIVSASSQYTFPSYVLTGSTDSYVWSLQFNQTSFISNEISSLDNSSYFDAIYQTPQMNMFIFT